MSSPCIRICQYYGNSIISKLIKWRTWSDISHTSALLDDNTVIEAWKGSVVRQPWLEGHSSKTRISVYKVPCSEEQKVKFEEFLISKIGSPYDFMGIVGFGLRIPIESKTSWFCSELIFTAALHANIELLSRIFPYQVSPGDIDHSPILQYSHTLIVP